MVIFGDVAFREVIEIKTEVQGGAGTARTGALARGARRTPGLHVERNVHEVAHERDHERK